MSYPGDCPQKRAARACAYISLAPSMLAGSNHPDYQDDVACFFSKRHIVISSREGGDIKFLLSLGVNPENIIACDRDRTARKVAKSYSAFLYPEPICEDFWDTTCQTVESYPDSIGSGNGDFMSTTNGRDIEIADLCLQKLPPTTGFFLTLTWGRDKGKDTKKRVDKLNSLSRFPNKIIQYVGKNGMPMAVVIFNQTQRPMTLRDIYHVNDTLSEKDVQYDWANLTTREERLTALRARLQVKRWW